MNISRFFGLHRPVPTPAVLAGRTPTLPPVSLPAPPVAAEPYTPPVTAPATPPMRATYRVRFDGSIPDLIIRQATRAELAATVTAHVRPYVRVSHVVIDAYLPFIIVRSSDTTVARATFEVLPTGGGLR